MNKLNRREAIVAAILGSLALCLPCLANWLWWQRVLTRYNRAIAADKIVPFKVIDKPFVHKDFVLRMHSMLVERRRDPANWAALPFPVQYKAIGGQDAQPT